MLSIALPKGRLGDKVYNMMTAAGYECPDYADNDRKLIVESPDAGMRYLLVKPSDVAVYVEHAAADIGIVGKDILMENEPDIYELLDLGIGKCRMCVAGPVGFEYDQEKTLRVATKYVNVAKKHFMEENRDIEIIKLNGSIELGPILGLTDVIVDIVETGTTIKENDLEIVEAFKDISARLIANKASFKFKNKEITQMTEKLREIVRGDNA
jgi:ATP phosphoribosyltransferase regulatory subunit